jgi:calcium/calmodulin-dependent protein kinase I
MPVSGLGPPSRATSAAAPKGAAASQSHPLTGEQQSTLAAAAQCLATAVSASSASIKSEKPQIQTELSILSIPMHFTDVQTLEEHVNSLTPEKKQALVDSAVKDVANGGHNLLKLLTRNPDMFKTVVHAGENRPGVKNRLIEAMDTNSKKISPKLLSAASSHLPKYIVDQCTKQGANLCMNVDFDKGAKMIARFFDMGVMSLHQALGSITGLQFADTEGAASKTGKEAVPEVLGVLRNLVGIQGCEELRDGLAIRNQFAAMSERGERAGGVLNSLNAGGSLNDEGFRDSLNQTLTAVAISLKFTGDKTDDEKVKLALKNISEQTGTGAGGDEMIFNQLTRPELKELKAMALLPDGQRNIEARLNSYSGSTSKAATAIATACIATNPIVILKSKAAVKRLIKQLDSRLKTFRSLVNAWQKNFSPEKYKQRKLDKLETLVNNIQKEVNENRLTWDQETRTLAVAMVRQKITQYIAQLDKLGSSPAVKKALMEQRDALLAKIDGVVVPASQFEQLTPKGNLSRIEAPTKSDPTAKGAPSLLEIGNKTYAISEQIGKGTFGEVHRCEDKATGEKGVVKVVSLQDDIATLQALAEVYTSQQFVGHPHIMSPSSVAITVPDENEMRHLALVMPEADQGDMAKVVASLADESPAEQTTVLLKLLTDAADGLVEMHRKGFAHRDIKPDNIFVQTGSLGERVGRVGDLGTAQHQSAFGSLEMTGSYPYMPADTTVGLSVDSYAFGMMTFELLSGGSFPFLERETVEPGVNTPTLPALPDLHARIDALPNASDTVKLLIEKSLSAAPADRPTMLAWRDALLSEQRRG